VTLTPSTPALAEIVTVPIAFTPPTTDAGLTETLETVWANAIATEQTTNMAVRPVRIIARFASRKPRIQFITDPHLAISRPIEPMRCPLNHCELRCYTLNRQHGVHCPIVHLGIDREITQNKVQNVSRRIRETSGLDNGLGFKHWLSD